MTSQMVIWFFSFRGIFYVPSTELLWVNGKADWISNVWKSAKARRQKPDRMHRTPWTQSRDRTQGRALMQLGETGGGAFVTHICFISQFTQQELRVNQSKVATSLHRAGMAHPLVCNFSLAHGKQGHGKQQAHGKQQGSLPVATHEVGLELRKKLNSCYTCFLYTRANIAISEQLTLAISALPHFYFYFHCFIFIFARISWSLNQSAPVRP